MKIIRTKELARILSVSPVTIWRMSKRGELPPKVKISPRITGWLEKDISEWLKKRQLSDSNNLKTEDNGL